MQTFVAYCLRSRWLSALCLAVVLVLPWIPPDAFGLPLCQFKNFTGLPCVSCGLTRSMVAMAHLDVLHAYRMHPAGLALFLLVLGWALLAFVPRSRREILASRAEKRGFLWNSMGIGAAVLFFGYGLGRIVWLWKTGAPSVW